MRMHPFGPGGASPGLISWPPAQAARSAASGTTGWGENRLRRLGWVSDGALWKKDRGRAPADEAESVREIGLNAYRVPQHLSPPPI